jgi:hypothetical protein
MVFFTFFYINEVTILVFSLTNVINKLQFENTQLPGIYVTSKVKMPLSSPWRQIGGGEVGLSVYVPLTATPDVGERSVSRPKTLCSERNHGSECKGAGMDTRVGLDFSLKKKSLNFTRNPNPRPFSPQRVAILRRGLHWATLHTIRQRLHSQASERAASELTTPVTWTNVIAGRSATSALVLSEQNCFITTCLLAKSVTLCEFTSGMVNQPVRLLSLNNYTRN